MPTVPGREAEDAIASVLEQVPTMEVETVSWSDDGSVARVRVQGGRHEIVCELSRDGSLRSAHVVEL